MIEILLSKNKKVKSTYNLYSNSAPADSTSAKWSFVQTLNIDSSDIEWHHKTFFPYLIDPKTFQVVNAKEIGVSDLVKILGSGKAKVLNIRDGIETV